MIIVEAFLQEADVAGDVFIIGTAARERLTIIVENNIERLGVGTELGTL